ncbi:MAG: AsnC family transcriptional regulator [Microbacterium sp.]
MDELDYGVLDALTVRPRAPWAAIGSALQVSAATASRRWDAMRSTGQVWMSSYPGPRYGPDTRVVEIHLQCAPRARADIAKALAERPGMFSVSALVGGWDFVVNTQTNSGVRGIEGLLADPALSHPGIHRRTLSQVIKTYSEGHDWRIGALEPRQASELSEGQSHRPDANTAQSKAMIARMLQENPRASVSEIAQALHTNPTTVSRRVDALLRGGEIVVRTEVSAALSGWSEGGYLFFDVPARLLDAVGQYVAHLSTTRLSHSVINSDWNLSTVHWLNHADQLTAIEADANARFPEARVVARAIRLREIKRVGWVLDDRENALRRVPALADAEHTSR